MSSNNAKSFFAILFLLISSTLLIYVAIRASTLSFTHDESLSYTIANGDLKWNSTANNHLLNTLLMSIAKNLFGTSELSLRLPNILLFVTYLFGCYYLLRKTDKIWISILGISLLLINPYIIEFFSIARGYGISLGFMLMSIYFTINDLEKPFNHKLLFKNFALAILFSSLAIYANLALINFGICVIVLFSLRLLYIMKNISVDKKFVAKILSLATLSYTPIILGIVRLLKLKEANELYFGADSLEEGLHSVLHASVFNKEYAYSAAFIIEIILSLSLIIGIIHIINSKRYTSKLASILLILILLSLGLFAENYLFDAKYPLGRTALFYIPILAIYVYQLMIELSEQQKLHKKVYIPLIAFVISILTINFIDAANTTYITDWKYEAHTKDALKEIEKIIEKGDKTFVLSNHWLYEPTINYYIKTRELHLNPATRDEIKLDADFIYRLNDSSYLNNFNTIKLYKDINSELLINKDIFINL